MTKTEMVDKLNGAGKGTKTALRKLGEEELVAMVSELENEPIHPVETPLDEVPVTPLEPSEKVETKVLSEFSHQLGIFTEFIYHVQNKGAKAVVTNAGNGDMYVCGDKEPKVGDKDTRITTGESVTITDAVIVRAIAASQPEIKITEIE